MKTTILLLSLFCFSLAEAQMPRTQVFKVNAHDWSNETVFEMSPSPIIKGTGVYSDSLSNQFGGTYYAVESDYYRVVSWADYYYWFTKKFSQFFSEPLLYEFYYRSGDNIGMASYIASHRYLGRYYPTVFQLSFDGGYLTNRLGHNRYLALKEKQRAQVGKALADGQLYNATAKARGATMPARAKATSKDHAIAKSVQKTSPMKVATTRQVVKDF